MVVLLRQKYHYKCGNTRLKLEFNPLLPVGVPEYPPPLFFKYSLNCKILTNEAVYSYSYMNLTLLDLSDFVCLESWGGGGESAHAPLKSV